MVLPAFFFACLRRTKPRCGVYKIDLLSDRENKRKCNFCQMKKKLFIKLAVFKIDKPSSWLFVEGMLVLLLVLGREGGSLSWGVERRDAATKLVLSSITFSHSHHPLFLANTQIETQIHKYNETGFWPDLNYLFPLITCYTTAQSSKSTWRQETRCYILSLSSKNFFAEDCQWLSLWSCKA